MRRPLVLTVHRRWRLGSRRPISWRYALDPANQPMKCLRIVEPAAKFHPCQPPQERRQRFPRRHRRTRQQHRDHPMALIPHQRVESVPHLLVLPRPEMPGTEKNHTGPASLQRLLKRLLPRLAGHQVPFVEKRLDSHASEATRQLFNRWLIPASVAQKNVVDRTSWHGGEALLRQDIPGPQRGEVERALTPTPGRCPGRHLQRVSCQTLGPRSRLACQKATTSRYSRAA